MKKKKLLLTKKGAKLSRKNEKVATLKRIPFTKIIYFSIAMNALSIVAVMYFQNSLPPQVPLFYGLAEGEDQLTESRFMIIAPIVAFTLIGINVLLAAIIKNDLLKKTLIIASFFVSLFSFVTLSQIFFLIGPF